MSPLASALCERSKRDDNLIAGSIVRALCMEMRDSDTISDQLAECLRYAMGPGRVPIDFGANDEWRKEATIALLAYDAERKAKS